MMSKKKLNLALRYLIAAGVAMSVSSAFAVLSDLEKKEIELRVKYQQLHQNDKQQRLDQIKSNALNIMAHKPPTAAQIQAGTTLNSIINPSTPLINQNNVTTSHPTCKNDCTNPNYRYIYINNKPYYQIGKSGKECICPNAASAKQPSTTTSSTDTSGDSSLPINYQ